MHYEPPSLWLNRRKFVLGASGLTTAALVGCQSQPRVPTTPNTPVIKSPFVSLTIQSQTVNFTGQKAKAVTVNGSLPGPTLRWREGDLVTVHTYNKLNEDTSIHWHGLTLPTDMDGVPGLSFAGIKPGEIFKYQFKLQQSGTYWYHSHSHFQEAQGVYGAIVIEPKMADAQSYDRDYVVLLSDWSDSKPSEILATLKKQSHFYNVQERTLGDVFKDIGRQGFISTVKNRAMWNRMRMSDRDLADVTGYTYTYLMNGVTPDAGWTGLFAAGERIKLRFINGSAMTLFDVRIPGLCMTVVAADGQNIQPVHVDEFRIGVAETYDVIVEPDSDRAYAIFAQTIDRSGYALGQLTPRLDVRAEVPKMDFVPVLSHQDMGMDMSGMAGHANHGADTDHKTHAVLKAQTDHSAHADHMAAMQRPITSAILVGSPVGRGENFGPPKSYPIPATAHGPQIDALAAQVKAAIDDPGVGLRDHAQRLQRRVLTYADLKGLQPTQDKRPPSREIVLHLTGNMHRYMWSVDGLTHAQAEPIILHYGERVRFILVNHTMMTHPFHMHGLWSELETGDADYLPRKHTTLVQPGARLSYLVTASELGRWAYHCHLLFHMAGMMREVRVIEEPIT